MIGIYSRFSINGELEYDNGDGWSREHIWAKSRGDFGTSNGPGTDLHHLRAADISTNSARSNRNFDNATEPYVDASGQYSGTTPSYTSSTAYIWEPPDEVKGDIARMMFYMVVRYEGDGSEPDLELTDEYQDASSTEPFHARFTTLVEWHHEDPVDDAERARNEIVYSYQKNRNLFIDHPEYVEEIWFPVITGIDSTISYSANLISPNPLSDRFTTNLNEGRSVIYDLKGNAYWNCTNDCQLRVVPVLQEMPSGVYIIVSGKKFQRFIKN